MITLYKVLTGVTSVLAITVCILAWLIQPEGMARVVIAFAVFLSLASAGGMWAILSMADNPKSDKALRR
jgi:hypothetical protein